MIRPDLHFAPRYGWYSAGLALALGMGFGLAMTLADLTLFKTAVPLAYTEKLLAIPLSGRLQSVAVAVLFDELVYRGLVMSALVWLLTAINRRAAAWCYVLALIVVAQVVHPLTHLPYWAQIEPGTLPAIREIVLHGGAGMLWGWLYWRHGWTCALIGHLAAHIALDPLLALTVP